ncbi:MAG: hypothetical protein ABH851_04955 [Methanobacteriota archaeon]
MAKFKEGKTSLEKIMQMNLRKQIEEERKKEKPMAKEEKKEPKVEKKEEKDTNVISNDGNPV